jgi:hypothetical protein
LLTDYDIASGVLELSITASANPTIPGFGSSVDSQGMSGMSGMSGMKGDSSSSSTGVQAFAAPVIPKNNGDKLLRKRGFDHSMPLDEVTLARFVSHSGSPDQSIKLRGDASSVSKSHRSSSYKARHVAFVPAVDVYVAIHLAHRTMSSDSPIPLRDAVRFVQNELLTRPPTKTDGTLGRLLDSLKKRSGGGRRRPRKPDGAKARAPPIRHQDLLDVVARRGPEYSTSAFEIDTLSRFLGVNVVLLDELRPEDLASSKRLQEASSKRLAELRLSPAHHQDHASRPMNASKWYIVLRKRADGKGHDLALSPSTSDTATLSTSRAAPPGAGAGHRLLFASEKI